MTVAELIARLQGLPPSLPIYRHCGDHLREVKIGPSEMFILLDVDDDGNARARYDAYPEYDLLKGETRIRGVVI